jgi:hypothetical protein
MLRDASSPVVPGVEVGESFRLADASTRPSGIPAPSVSRTLHAELAAAGGAGADVLAAAGRLRDAPAGRDVLQRQADEPVIGVAGNGLQPGEDPCPDPFVAALPDRGRRAGEVRDGLIRAAEPQDLDELLEDDPVADPGPVTAQRMGRIVDRAGGQQRRKLLPQRLQQP